jgi:hypothetical protein
MEAITCREAMLGTDALAAPAAVSPTAVLAHRPREPFGYLALAGHRERPRWRHPFVLPRKREVPSGRLAACVGPAMDGPLPVHALPFGDIQPVLYPVPQPFDRACAIDVRDTVAKAKRRHQSDALHSGASVRRQSLGWRSKACNYSTHKFSTGRWSLSSMEARRIYSARRRSSPEFSVATFISQRRA